MVDCVHLVVLIKDAGDYPWAAVMQVFAPANLRATADNPAYGELVRHWMEQRYTLRYSGGMVPDVNHIFAKARALCWKPSSSWNHEEQLTNMCDLAVS